MILPVIAYGNSILKQKCTAVDDQNPILLELIGNMWETMHRANGCGLAAPQIGQSLKLFIVDSTATYKLMDAEERETYFEAADEGITETFINAEIIDYSDEEWEDYEGCLSIPGLSQKVKRAWTITIRYLDKDLKPQTRTFSGTTARIIQHEYDHTKGILFLDYLKPLTKKLMASKLKRIQNGQTETFYPMKFLK